MIDRSYQILGQSVNFDFFDQISPKKVYTTYTKKKKKKERERNTPFDSANSNKSRD